jgi:hypothetical protein
MSGALLVVPVVDPVIGKACLDTIHPDVWGDLLVIDNCEHPLSWGAATAATVVRLGRNLGVARSWNMALRTARAWGRSAVALVSASVRFGESGGRDLVTLDPGEWGLIPGPAHWHTVILTMALFERLGEFDENFFPAYYEDIDMIRRGLLAGIDIGAGDVVLDLICGAPGHGVDALRHRHPGKPTINYGALADYWEAKWGLPVNDAGDLTRGHSAPFGKDVPLSWWEPATIDELLVRYGIEGR